MGSNEAWQPPAAAKSQRLRMRHHCIENRNWKSSMWAIKVSNPSSCVLLGRWERPTKSVQPSRDAARENSPLAAHYTWQLLHKTMCSFFCESCLQWESVWDKASRAEQGNAAPWQKSFGSIRFPSARIFESSWTKEATSQTGETGCQNVAWSKHGGHLNIKSCSGLI